MITKIKYFFGRKCLSVSEFFKRLSQKLLTPPKPSISSLNYSCLEEARDPKVYTFPDVLRMAVAKKDRNEKFFIETEMSAKDKRDKNKTLDQSFAELTDELGNEAESILTASGR